MAGSLFLVLLPIGEDQNGKSEIWVLDNCLFSFLGDELAERAILMEPCGEG